MNLEQQTYHRWENERDDLRSRIAALESGAAVTEPDGKDNAEESLAAARAALADTERLLEKYDHWRE